MTILFLHHRMAAGRQLAIVTFCIFNPNKFTVEDWQKGPRMPCGIVANKRDMIYGRLVH
jgi:hypothetical protein